MADLTGRRALVTGAGSGMGRGIALRLARDGAAVAVLDVVATAAEETVATVRAGGGTAVPLAADVADEQALAGAVSAAAGALGGLDVLVPNAAVQAFGADARVHELDSAVWQRTVSVNLGGAFLTLKHGLPHLMAAGGGSVVVIGSPTGFVATAPGFTAYSASKGGLLALVRVVAVDYAREGVRANLVVPGFTDTPLVRDILESPDDLQAMLATIPLGRPGTAEEVGAMVAFLASDDARYATGGVFTVDGGMTAV
jgi:NAD(P)-dependent dehydrogenase (short-subunit alcohol dehydrogenase family)